VLGWLGRIPSVSAASAVVIGLSALASWVLEVEPLKSVVAGFETMKANTAISFILVGASLWLLRLESASNKHRRIAQVCAGLVVLVASVTLSEYVLKWNAGIDELLFTDRPSATPGRMAPATALGFLMIGLSLLLLDCRPHFLSHFLTIAAGLVAGLALAGYMYGASALYAIGAYSSMAVHTAGALAILCLGVLCARPKRQLMAVISIDGPGGIIARRLLPAALVVPPLLGLLRLTGERAGLYGTEFGLSLVIVSTIVIFVSLISWNARSLQLVDLRRQAVEARFENILRMAADAIVAIDEDQRITLFNRGAEETFGYRADEVLGQPLDVILPARLVAVHRQHVRDFAEGRRQASMMGEGLRVFGRRKDGSEFPAEASISKLGVKGQMVLTAIIRDITERTRAEEALRARTEELKAMSQQLWQAAKLATMGELAASVAHELNNPLATVSLRIDSLLAQSDPESPTHRELETMEQEVDRMGKLVANLLHFSRRSQSQLSTFDVTEEISNTLELVHYHFRNRGIRVVCQYDSEIPMIQADRQQLRQVFLNLLTNASDAMPEGGTLTVRVLRGTTPNGEPAVRIDFSDTGVGIPAADLAKVTDPFYTTKPPGKGTGLGLAISRRAVSDHRGSLSIASEVGVGTTVTITLPVRNGGSAAGLSRERS
jgi:PAS domain S-box-containing protein